mmetsp:Transcript_135638/g.377777  ORF Transcript_135638/g.377777 Transcript_135638/m.377777 type:complete len:105 (+) Transcript_135638:199-513(+)
MRCQGADDECDPQRPAQKQEYHNSAGDMRASNNATDAKAKICRADWCNAWQDSTSLCATLCVRATPVNWTAAWTARKAVSTVDTERYPARTRCAFSNPRRDGTT